MRENILLVRKIYCVSCADFWVLSILGMPACRDYVIDPLLAASRAAHRTVLRLRPYNLRYIRANSQTSTVRYGYTVRVYGRIYG